jgi:prevent-host-death family protein
MSCFEERKAVKKIIPITDLQRQSRQIVSQVADSDEPVIITQRGRAAAVLLSAERYSRIEEDLGRLDELELQHLLERGVRDFAEGRALSQREVRTRLEKKHATVAARKRNVK